MSTYKSQKIGIAYPALTVYQKLSNLQGLADVLKNVPADKIPSDQRQMLDQVKVSADTISFPAGPVGEITLEVVERNEPSLIKLVGKGTPVPLSMTMHIMSLTPDTCEAYVEIDVQIPAMLAPMVNKPLQQMADQFGNMLRQIPFS